MIAIAATTHGGMDWHDIRTTTQFLKEKFKNDYNIASENINTVIANDVFKSMKGMFTSVTSFKDETTVTKKLENIPTFEEILKAVEKKETLEVHSNPDKTEYGEIYELTFTLKEKDGVIHVYQEYMYGQFSFDTDYVVYDIPDEKVGYIVAENFLCPMKGVPSISRFYHEAYDNLAEAKLAMKKMKLHKDYDSVKEMYIANMDEMREREWYKKNINAIGKPFQLFLSA